jgi:hypothetical protein
VSDLARVIKPIVEGQLRTFAVAHPAVIEAVDWRHNHPSKLDAFVSSVAKRVSNALLCEETQARLRSALGGHNQADEIGTSAAPKSAIGAPVRQPQVATGRAGAGTTPRPRPAPTPRTET